MRKLLLPVLFVLLAGYVSAQDAVNYQTPPREIMDLVLAPPLPAVSFDDKGNWMLTLHRNPFPGVADLAQPEYKLAGLRINAKNYSLSRQSCYSGISLKNLHTNAEARLTGLPQPLNIGDYAWSPSYKKLAFTQVNAGRVDLYVLDISSGRAARTNKAQLNVILGSFIWVDDSTLLYRTALHAATVAPVKPVAPTGPVVQQSLGKVAPNATLQDLIKSPYDEKLFEFLASSQLMENRNGVENPVGKPAIYSSVSVSPDKNYLLTRSLRKPYSYLVGYYGFPSRVSILDRSGKVVKVLADLPSTEVKPSGYDNIQNVPRAFEWRDDLPAAVVMAVPLDSGLIRKQVPYRDAVYQLLAPFNGKATELFKTTMRYAGVSWGDTNLALVYERSRLKQLEKISSLDPSSGKMDELISRNTTDAYNDPGEPLTGRNKFGKQVLLRVDDGGSLLMNNKVGSSPQGDLPFLAKFNLKAKKNEIIWRCSPGAYETVAKVLDARKLVLVTRRERQTEAPNYFLKHLVLRVADRRLSDFGNPYKGLAGVSKEKISYKRADGLDLTGDLYLPSGYDKEKDGPLPVLIWAYPREFNSADDAAQLRGSKDRFISVSPGGPVFFVTQGYAVLDNAEMPIAGSNGKRPNDTFVEQLKMNAEAAINKLSDLGVGDRKRVAVGGHSYGAFMTANLLAHTNLFKAGIARSGAYNRTLTPFGFQNEDRTYWQAPQLYYDMSPFSYADKIKTPILLIHGEMDDNPGTFPINSERLYNAVKGHGGVTRLVYLPFEAHGYKAQENILHMLWEMNTWLETYVKPGA